jgi:hypothetical protein
MGVSAVVGIVGAVASASSAHDASVQQETMGNKAIAAQQQALTQQQAIQQPYVTAGQTALDRLVQGTAPGGEFAKPFSMADSPAQQYATKSALAGMQNQMAVGGQGLSSNAISGAGTLAANIGSQFENQAYNQWLTSQQQAMAPLQNIASMGQASASGQAANIGQSASNIGNLQTGIGNVQAAGTVAGGNAISGAANNASQYLMLQSLLGKGGTTGTTNIGQLTNPGQAPAGYDWGTMGQAYQ